MRTSLATLRPVAAGFLLSLLLPLAAAVAGFEGGEWSTAGKIRVSALGSGSGAYTTLEARFPSEFDFVLEDPEGLVLTGTMEPVGRRGTTARGALDGGSMEDFATGLEEYLVAAYGGEWIVTPDRSDFRAKLKRQETRLAVKLRMWMMVWFGGTGQTVRFKVTIATRSAE